MTRAALCVLSDTIFGRNVVCMKRRQTLAGNRIPRRHDSWFIAVVVALWALVGQGIPESNAEAAPDAAAPPLTWEAALKEDTLFDSDNQFTGSASIRLHSGVFRRLSQVHGTPAFGQGLARLVLPDRPGLMYREGWLLGYSQQTPEHLGDNNLIRNDFPYVSLIAWGNTYTAFNDRNLYSAELLLGWVGPATGGEQIQSAIHSVAGNRPDGWHNQLDNEPIFNLYYTFQHKLWRRPHFDIASSFTGALGNYFTYGQTGLVARFGQLPRGFAATPNPIGRGIDYDAIVTPSDHGNLYVTFAVRGTAIGYSLERQGNTFRADNAWTEHNTLDMKPVVAQFIGGINYVRPHWGVHFTVWMTTATVHTGRLTNDSNAHNNFGSIRFEWRF